MARHKRQDTLTEAELSARLKETKQLLKQVRAEERERTIFALGELAYQAGLQHCDPQYLAGIFRQLGQGIILVPQNIAHDPSNNVEVAECLSVEEVGG